MIWVMVLLPAICFTQHSYELKVTVSDLTKMQGTVRVCLTNKKADFLKTCYRSVEVPVTGKTVTAIFTDIPSGNYAVAVYHDEDNNRELNKGGLFGIPTEAYGFSNNPVALFGPPGYDKCTFKVVSDMAIEIDL
jgi:uncharacterized protein (DUF2141 family)